jgi:threonine dehydratase
MTNAREAGAVALSTLVDQFRKNADQIAHLAAVTSQELCDLHPCQECLKRDKDTHERIHLFVDLMEKLAEEIGTIAETIEGTDFERLQPVTA